MNVNDKNILTLGFSVGTRAIDTYDKCCDLFGFKYSHRGKFAQQKKLYAINATPEGYNVWMLAHNSILEDFSEARNWFNIIVDRDTIKEVWFDTTEASDKDFVPRVLFVKTLDRRYTFYGVFVLEKAGMEEILSKFLYVRTFKKISSIYPIDANIMTSQSPKAVPSKAFSIPGQDQIASITEVVDGCFVEAYIIEKDKKTGISVDLSVRPFQKSLIGKRVGDIFSLPNVDLTYRIEKITK